MEDRKQRLNVLLVEDDEDDQIFIRDLLQEFSAGSYSLEWAPNYQTGLNALERDHHDVCLLDYRLGRHSGLDFLREVVNRGCNIPVILLTGYGDYEVDIEAMQAGAADYLSKEQISGPLLERSIRYAVQRKRIERDLTIHAEEMKKLTEDLSSSLEKLKGTEEELRTRNEHLIEAQRSIELERRRYADLFEFAPDGYMVTDPNGTIYEANKAACKLLGEEKGTLSGTPLAYFVVSEDRKQFYNQIRNLRFTDSVEGFEIRIVPHHGGLFYATINISVVAWPNGHGKSLRWLIRDVTARKKIEDELKKYREHLESLVEQRTSTLKAVLDTVPVGLVLTRTEGEEISYFSPGTTDILGEPVTGSLSSICKLMKPDGAPFNSDELPLSRSLRGERVSDVEILLARRDGSMASVLMNSAPVVDPSNRITGVVVSLIDITKRKRVEDAIRQSEALLQKVLDALPVGVWIVDRDGCILRGNPTGQWIWGCSKLVCIEDYSQFKGWSLGSGKQLKPEEWGVFRAITNGETTLNEEIEIETLDGTRRFILYSAIPISDKQNGEISGAIILNQDITSMKRADRQIRYLTQQLIKGQENERQKLSYDLHDVIGQELSALKIGLDTLGSDLPKNLPRLKNKVIGLSKMLQGTIMGVRDLSYTLRPATLEQLGLSQTINQYCREFTNTYGVMVNFHTAGVDGLKLDYDTSITLYRLVQESLSNVRKHAEAGSVAVKLVGCYPFLILSIADDGKGFDAADRLGSASKERCMGLRSMEERIALLDGKMKIESSPAQGTLIRFEVPYKEGCHGQE